MCTQSPSRLTLINAYACIRVDLPDGTYTLTQEGDGTVEGELNQASVQQDLDQSPEEPKACVGGVRGRKAPASSNPFYKLKSCPLTFSTLLL
jgi:hypothetical protein